VGAIVEHRQGLSHGNVAAQLSVDRQKEMADIKSMVNTLIMGMKSLLYSLSSHGNTAVVPPSAIAPGVVLPPSFGLREDEIEVRAKPNFNPALNQNPDPYPDPGNVLDPDPSPPASLLAGLRMLPRPLA